METEYIVVDKENPEEFAIDKGARLLNEGEVVAFPTETVYGLGANALDARAASKIFAAKGRPSDNPLIVHVAEIDEVNALVQDISGVARTLMEKFWPGPLTLILPKSEMVPYEVSAGLDTVALRMPEHPVALALIKAAGVPVAAPSANLSGKPSPTIGKHVWEDLNGKIAMVLDGGEARVGVESTVLDLTHNPPLILRPGGITLEMLQESIGEVEFEQGIGEHKVPRSPGMKYTHYAPEAEVFIVKENDLDLADEVMKAYKKLEQEGRRVAVLISEETALKIEGKIKPCYQEILGSRMELTTVAQKLFSSLRNCDVAKADVVLIEEFPHNGMGAAIMNRVKKAAGDKVIN